MPSQQPSHSLYNTIEALGGMTLLLCKVLRACVPYPRFDWRETLRNAYKMGVESVPIICLTAFFTGAILVVQSGIFVRRFGAHSLLGWGTGYAIFRQVGPALIALMFSGRVGSNNTADLGTMTVTEQIDGLRALAIDPVPYLILPRIVAMITMIFLLTLLGNVVAILGGALFGKLVVGVDISTFWISFTENLRPTDLLYGLSKAVAFGFVISITSCYYGIAVKGGAVGVGRSVNASVVASAIGIMVIDFIVTFAIQ